MALLLRPRALSRVRSRSRYLLGDKAAGILWGGSLPLSPCRAIFRVSHRGSAGCTGRARGDRATDGPARMLSETETAPPRENYKAACLHTDRYVHAFRARTVPAGAPWACVNIGTPAYPDRVAGRALSAPHNHANRGRAQTLPQPRTLGGPPNALCGARAGTGHSTAALQRSTPCSALRDIRAAAREPRAFHGQRQISWRSWPTALALALAPAQRPPAAMPPWHPASACPR